MKTEKYILDEAANSLLKYSNIQAVVKDSRLENNTFLLIANEEFVIEIKSGYNTEGMFSITLKRPKFNDDSETKDAVCDELGDKLGDELDDKLVDSMGNELKTVEKSSEKILALILQNNFITIFELSKKIGITTRAIEKQIHKLKDMKVIEHIGPDKGGHWQLLDRTYRTKGSE